MGKVHEGDTPGNDIAGGITHFGLQVLSTHHRFGDGHAGSKYSDMAPSFCGFYSFSTTSCRPFVDWPGIFMLISITIFFTQPSEAMS